MKNQIYLDNAATTKMDKRVFKAMEPYFCKFYGNPGSMHSLGLEAKKILNESRKKVSEVLNCNPKEIIFTGSGTESINMAIKGVANALKEKGNHIITQKTEHHAVLETCKFLEKQGFKATYLNVDRFGIINLKELEKAIDDSTILVSIMYANNEIGTIQSIKEISKICKEKNVLFHTDACQATGYLEINVKKLGVDLMSINGSKIYGPKGIGALYIREGVKIIPLIHGGGQENKLRSGTENIPLIVGFAKALELCEKEKQKEIKRITKLRDKLIKGILENVSKTFLNGHPEKRLPNNVNVSILDIEGEAILLYLNEQGICASSGSACTSKTLDPSHVILATGLPYEAAHGSIRFSLGRFNKEQDIKKVIDVLPEIVEKLRKISPVNLNMKDFKIKAKTNAGQINYSSLNQNQKF